MSYSLIAAATQLADTLARENSALDALDVSGAVALLPEKRTALAAFEAAQAKGLRPDLRPEMAQMVERLQGLAAENRRLLQRALTVQTRVIEVVVAALPREEQAGRYGQRRDQIRASRPAAWSLVARV